MTDSAVWKGGQYQPVENDDPDMFHLLISKSFVKLDVAETIANFEAMVLTVQNPLNLLRVVSQVRKLDNMIV